MRIMRLKEIIEKTGLSRSTIYNLISQGRFPKQIELGARSVGWVDAEIDEWLETKVVHRNAQQE